MSVVGRNYYMIVARWTALRLALVIRMRINC